MKSLPSTTRIIKNRKIVSWFILLLLNFPFFFQTSAQGFLKASGKSIVNSNGTNILLRGIGLGGWMLQEGYMLRVPGPYQQQHKIRERIDSLIGPARTQDFYDAWLAGHMREADIRIMKKDGFNSVRLPIHYNLFTLPADKEPVRGGNTWLQKGFALTDSLLAWCKRNSMYLILDLHGAPGGQGNDLNISDRDPSKPSLWEDELNRQKTVALWNKLAARYANDSWIGAYDIINEPNWGFTDPVNDKNGLKEQSNAPLKKLMMDITAAIRQVDTNHLIIVEGNGWGNNYNGIFPLWDRNMAVSFHKYWNRNDPASIKNMLAVRDTNNVPIWLGETGENSNVWFTQAIRLFEENNIGWSWWPLKKIGANNPLEIVSNPAYDSVLGYWNGRSPKPDAETAYRGLMKLADDTKAENNIHHIDVVDAMFRQVHSSQAIPYTINQISNGTVLFAVNYDLGRNGSAYSDNDTADYHIAGQRAGNRGRTYRNDGVDITRITQPVTGYCISDFEPGEWLQYTVDVKIKGTYTLKLSVAADKEDGRISAGLQGRLPSVETAIPNTGSISNFKSVEMKNIQLDAGLQVLRMYSSGASFSFLSIQFIGNK